MLNNIKYLRSVRFTPYYRYFVVQLLHTRIGIDPKECPR